MRTVGLIAVIAALGAAGLAPRAAVAQFAQRSTERVLFLVPNPVGPEDSAYALDFAHEVRRRLDNKMRHRLFSIPTDQVCEMLTESGYQCGAILGAADAERLARALQADAYIVGDLDRPSQRPIGTYRLVDIGRSGLSGWMTVHGTPGDPPRGFAETFVDSMSNQVRAAEDARDCIAKRDKGDYRDARRSADDAFRLYPNHPSAAMCVAVVLEAQQASSDSIITMLERASVGDSLFERAWERLGRLYQEKGDSLNALAAFRRQLELNPSDRTRWLGVIAGYITVREFGQARDLADDWLSRQPGDLEFVQLKARACGEGELWGCALEALAAWYGADSALVGDTVFYPRIIGAALEAGDTAAALEWSTEAVRQAAGSVTLWRAHANALQDVGLSDSVVSVYERILELEPTDYRSALAAGRIVLDGLVIDTLTPLDTARLARGESLLDRAVGISADTSVQMNVSALLAQPGIRLARARMEFPTAIRLLEKANRYNVQGLESLARQTNFFLGFALMFEIFEFDQRVTASENCGLVEQEADMIRRGRAALTAGADLSPGTAQQLLQQYRTFEQRIPTLRQAYCG